MDERQHDMAYFLLTADAGQGRLISKALAIFAEFRINKQYISSFSYGLLLLINSCKKRFFRFLLFSKNVVFFVFYFSSRFFPFFIFYM